uniref:SOC1 n=1 Tax=Davidia involucrata TaxID=16924 RepID=A0A5B7AAZ1_DAVIN|nr:SOC1 [Davidia involucrata]
MVRGKTQMKRIENATSRQVTFSKRRSGLLKKAFELSVLCDAEVALIVFSTKGRLYEFSSSSINKTIERYQRNSKDIGISKKTVQEDMQHLKEEAVSMAKKIELIEDSNRKLLGDGLESCSVDNLQQIEDQLNRGLSKIRARKHQLYREKIEQLKEEGRILEEENGKLREKCELQSPNLSIMQQEVPQKQILEVETELFIGPPETRTTVEFMQS